MQSHKLSVSLPQQQFEFIDDYRQQYHCKSRSDVIKKALQLLQQKQLEEYYQQANQEIDLAFETTSGDGLGNE